MSDDQDATSHEDEWVDLGVCNGNKDSETEKVTRLAMPYGKTHGLVCRYIRVYPLSAAEGGFHGAKSMRVGVYGHTPFTSRDHVKDSKDANSGNADKGHGEMIKDKSIPAAIITIKQPSKDLRRNCWAVNGRAAGVYAAGLDIVMIGVCTPRERTTAICSESRSRI